TLIAVSDSRPALCGHSSSKRHRYFDQNEPLLGLSRLTAAVLAWNPPLGAVAAKWRGVLAQVAAWAQRPLRAVGPPPPPPWSPLACLLGGAGRRRLRRNVCRAMYPASPTASPIST